MQIGCYKIATSVALWVEVIVNNTLPTSTGLRSALI